MVLLDAIARRLAGRARRGLRRARELQRRARRRARVPALHAPGRVLAAGTSPTCSSRGTTPGSTAGGRAEPRAERSRERRRRPAGRPTSSCRTSVAERGAIHRPEQPEAPEPAEAPASTPAPAAAYGQPGLGQSSLPRAADRSHRLDDAATWRAPQRGRSWLADAARRAAISLPVLAAPGHELPPPPEPRAGRAHSRNPVDRLTRGLPDPLRVTIDWIVTIVGAVAIVLLVKAFVVNPYRIPSSSMEPTLHCAQPAARLRGALLRPRAREPLPLPPPRSAPWRDHRLQDAAGGADSSAVRAAPS